MRNRNTLLVLEELIKNQGSFVSGSNLSQKLGITRTAIKKIMDRLANKGYLIEARTGSGYLLSKLPDYPDSYAVQAILNSMGLSNINYFYFPEIDSTQNEALRFLTSKGFKLEPGQHYVFAAGRQTGGKGRMGRSWYSEEGGIWITFVFNQTIFVKELPYYPLAAVLAVIDFLQGYFGISCKLKWPNDVVYRDRKIAGILTGGRVEVDIASQLLIGVGVNVNNELPPELKSRVVTVAEVTGEKQELLSPTVNLITNLYFGLSNMKPRDVIARSNQLLWKKNEEGVVTGPSGKKERVLVKKISSSGGLIAVVNGERKTIFSAEIDWP